MASILPTPIPPASPAWASFAKAMSNYNPFGQSALIIARLRERKTQCVGLYAGIQRQCTLIAEEIERVKLEQQELQYAQELRDQALDTIRKKRMEHEALVRELENQRRLDANSGQRPPTRVQRSSSTLQHRPNTPTPIPMSGSIPILDKATDARRPYADRLLDSSPEPEDPNDSSPFVLTKDKETASPVQKPAELCGEEGEEGGSD